MRQTACLPFLFLLVVLVACAPPPATETVESQVDTPAQPVSPTNTPSATRPPSAGGGCTAYVAPDGDDANPGSEAEPWLSFQYAAESARPGDVVCFREGTYPVEETWLTSSGEESALISFVAAPGEAVTLDGQDATGGIVVLSQGVSYVRLSGFTLRGYTIWGISLEGDNHDVTLDHLDVGGGESGIHFTVGDSGEDPWYGPVEGVTLEDSVIHDVVYTAVDCTPGPCNRMVFRRVEIYGAGFAGEESFAADGLAVERGQDILVADCDIHDNGGDGVDLNSRNWDGNVTGVLVQHNRVYRNRLQAIKLWAGGRMEYNAIWGQGFNPVSVGDYPGVYEIVNNTIAYNMWDADYSVRAYAFVAAYEGDTTQPITLTLLNNIFAFNTGPAVGSPTGIYLGPTVQLVQEGSNIFFSREDCEIEAGFVSGRVDPCFTQSDILSGAWAAATGLGMGTTVADPLFVTGWPEVDLRLSEGSPAAGSGAY